MSKPLQITFPSSSFCFPENTHQKGLASPKPLKVQDWGDTWGKCQPQSIILLSLNDVPPLEGCMFFKKRPCHFGLFISTALDLGLNSQHAFTRWSRRRQGRPVLGGCFLFVCFFPWAAQQASRSSRGHQSLTCFFSLQACAPFLLLIKFPCPENTFIDYRGKQAFDSKVHLRL